MININSTDATPAKMPVRAALKWLALAAVLSISLLFSITAPAHAQNVQDDSFSDGDVIQQVEITSPAPLDHLRIDGVAPDGTPATWDSNTKGMPQPTFDGQNYTYAVNGAWGQQPTVQPFIAGLDIEIRCKITYSPGSGWGIECEVTITF